MTQHLAALARNLRVRIFNAKHHTLHARIDQGLRTGGGSPDKGTGFETDKYRSACNVTTGIRNRIHFCMTLPGGLVIAATNHLAVSHNHAAHRRMGGTTVTPQGRKLQGGFDKKGIGLARPATCPPQPTGLPSLASL